MARPALSGTRTIEILNFFAAHTAQSFTLTELARRLDINLASAHAVLAALTDAGYLVRHPVHKTYQLGPLLIPIGRAAAERHRVVEIARRELERITTARGLEGLVVAATSAEMVILERVGRPLPSGMVSTVGQRIRIVPPLGAAFVATAAPDVVADWMGRVPDANAGARAQLASILEAVRERGYSVGLDASDRRRMRTALRELQEEPGSQAARTQLEHTVQGLARVETVLADIDRRRSYRVAHFASPVFDEHGGVALALYVLGFRERVTGAEVEAMGADLAETALAATAGTGGRVPVDSRFER